jgi:hypothetical protein
VPGRYRVVMISAAAAGRSRSSPGRWSQGVSFSHIFTTAGLFTYHCAIHPEMTGAVTITQAPDSGADTPVHQVPGTGIGIGTTAPGHPLPLALLAMVTATALGTGAVVGRRRPACVSHWGVRQRRSTHCR